MCKATGRANITDKHNNTTAAAAAAAAITEPKLSPPSRLIKLSGGNIHPGIHLGGNKVTLETATFSQRQTTDD